MESDQIEAEVKTTINLGDYNNVSITIRAAGKKLQGETAAQAMSRIYDTVEQVVAEKASKFTEKK